MDVTVWRDGNKYQLHFKKGKACGKKGQELMVEPADRKKTGTHHPLAAGHRGVHGYRHSGGALRKHAPPPGRRQRGRHFPAADTEKRQVRDARFSATKTASRTTSRELAGENPLTQPEFITAERKGQRPRGQARIQGQALRRLLLLQPRDRVLEYYHNSSWLENGGAPDKAVQHRLHLRDRRVHQRSMGKYQKNESRGKIPGRAGLPRPRHELLLYADLL